jgi:hypothetical protein
MRSDVEAACMHRCPVCAHTAIHQEARRGFVDSNCARCGILLARAPAHVLVGVSA